MVAYRASARQRWQQKCDRAFAHYQIGQGVAQQAAGILKTEFGAQRVVVFGSMRWRERVHERSDVDLAVWGLDSQEYYRAVGRLLGLDGRVLVDLMEVETAPNRIREVIEETGAEL